MTRVESKAAKFGEKPQTMNCVTSLNSKPVPAAFLFPLFLADLDKKYKNESEFDKE